MTDRYRVLETTEQPSPAQDTAARGGLTRPALWLLLVAGAVCNVVSSLADLHLLVNIGSGLAVLACGGALIAHHYRHRRR